MTSPTLDLAAPSAELRARQAMLRLRRFRRESDLARARRLERSQRLTRLIAGLVAAGHSPARPVDR